MKIIIKKKIPTSISLNPKHKPKYITKNKTIEIPEELTDKTIAVIDELLDRTYDDWEERSWNEVVFPLVPFPFFEKSRLPENIGINDYWISCWLNTNLFNIIEERTKIIDTLMELETMEEIKHHPVVNIGAGVFDGDNFVLVIERDKLHKLRKKILDKQEKETQKKEQNLLDQILPSQKEINNRNSIYSDRINTIDDLLQDIDLRGKCLAILDWGNNLIREKLYKVGTDEENDEIVLLMEELNLVKADWEGLKKQDHKQIGYRTIELVFEANKVLNLLDRINGKNAIIRKQSLEFIAHHLGDLDSGSRLVELLQSWGVPKPLIEYPNTKWRMIDTILTYYASSPSSEDQKMLFKLIEETAHPLMYNGDKEKALEIQDNFTNYLQYDGYCFSDGKIIKKTDEIIKEVDNRQKQRKNNKLLNTDEGLENLVRNITSPQTQQETIQKPIPIQIIDGQIRSEVKIVGQPEIKLKDSENQSITKPLKKTTLSSEKTSFVDDDVIIQIGKYSVSLPPYKNEHYFCRAIWEHKKNEPIDWSIIYEKMTGYYKAYYGKPQEIREKWRLVYDTMRAINKRIKDVINTNDNLFIWQEKTVKRAY